MFVEKLNKKQEGVYVIEEEKNVVGGVWEGFLDHDNVNRESLYIYTGPKLTGKKVENYFISTPSETPWKTHLKVFSKSEKIYITYETAGDQVEAEDINLVQDELVRAVAEDEKLSEDVADLKEKKADKIYIDTELNKVYKKEEVFTKEEVLQKIEEISDENYTLAEKNKLAGIEKEANKYIHPATHSVDMIVENSGKRFTSDVEKVEWNDASNKKHIHSNKSVLDKITQALVDNWNSAMEHISDGIRHITSSERTKWNNKADKSYVDTTFATKEEIGNAGFGDMMKSTYDKDNDGIVDRAKDADRLNGKRASDFVQIHSSNLPYVDSFIVYGDSDKYYPVIIGGGNQDLLRTIKIWRRYSERGPSDWYSSTHKGSLMLHWMGNFGSWGGASYSEFIYENTSQYTTLLADCFRYNHSMAYCFMLRGGGKTGAIYHIASDQPIRGHKDSSKPVDIFYNEEISFNSSNPKYVMHAPKPVTTINKSKLNRIKIAKISDIPTKLNQLKGPLIWNDLKGV